MKRKIDVIANSGTIGGSGKNMNFKFILFYFILFYFISQTVH
jgi:hypothetical protein